MKTIPSPLNGKAVLIVDDEAQLRDILALDLRRRGCVIFEASNGAEAMAVILKNDVDFVISDIRMSNGTGIELLEQVKKYNPKLPVVLLMTGFADVTEEEAIEKGAECLLDKPIDRKKLFDLLERKGPEK